MCGLKKQSDLCAIHFFPHRKIFKRKRIPDESVDSFVGRWKTIRQKKLNRAEKQNTHFEEIVFISNDIIIMIKHPPENRTTIAEAPINWRVAHKIIVYTNCY